MRIRVWQLIAELKEDTNVVLDRCREMNLRVLGRFSLLTEREVESVKEAIERFRKDEIEKKKATRVVRFAPGMSPEERKKKEDEEKRKKAIVKPAPKPATPAETAAAAAAKPAKTGKDDKDPKRKSADAAREERKARAARIKGQGGPPDRLAQLNEIEQDYTGMAALPGLHRMSRSGSRKHKKQPVLLSGTSEVKIPISLRDFSQAIGIKANDIILKSMKAGKMVNLNTMLGQEEVEALALEFGREISIKREKDADEMITDIVADIATRKHPKAQRAPVVTFMGHVDHGKTSLLDYIRKTSVASKEAGGITQHIGAYRVENDNLHITFLDTPGHEAFTALRARGANLTDIVVLVVAADDGVMPQTVEAITHAKAANVPIIIAINKMDKPSADPMRVKQQLMKYDLVPEEWGGSTICVNVSAVTGDGTTSLLEMIMLVAEMLELKATNDIPARGAVIEARKNEKQGAVATLLVQDGTLHVGDNLVIGSCYCRVRSIRDWLGRPMDNAGPSYPVEVIGLSDVPSAGDKFLAVENIETARHIAEERQDADKMKSVSEQRRPMTLQDFLKASPAEAKELNLIVKTDVYGSKEVLDSSLVKLSTAKAKINIIHSGVGGVNLADIQLADASSAIIICFNVVPEAKARQLAEQLKVEIRSYSIIYDLLNEMKNVLAGLLEPIRKEVVTARIEIRTLFRISKVGTIAGCFVREGTITRSDSVRLIRNNVVVFTGSLDSLKRFKDDAREVREGFECGIKIDGFDDIKEGDVIESFRIELIQPTLDGDKKA